MSVLGRWKGCARYDPAISLRALGVLDGEEAVRLEAHLATCPGCRARLAERQGAAARVRAWAAGAGPVELPATLRDRWSGGVRGDTASLAQARPVSLRPLEGAVRWWPAWTGERWAWAASAAAWVLIGVLQMSIRVPEPAPSGMARPDTAISWRSVVFVLKRGESGREEERTRPATDGIRPDGPGAIGPRPPATHRRWAA